MRGFISVCLINLIPALALGVVSATWSAPIAIGNAASATVGDLAPNGRLCGAPNFAIRILATKDSATKEPRGVSVNLERQLARRLDVPVILVTLLQLAI